MISTADPECDIFDKECENRGEYNNKLDVIVC